MKFVRLERCNICVVNGLPDGRYRRETVISDVQQQLTHWVVNAHEYESAVREYDRAGFLDESIEPSFENGRGQNVFRVQQIPNAQAKLTDPQVGQLDYFLFNTLLVGVERDRCEYQT